eukprot:c10154_g1_i4.p1 GENE.c10154_g1_i4~~c10154_g1_i4.p1  ORF type:complete len:314 (+),score=75.62 c10154_g1_i4:64-942(+)
MKKNPQPSSQMNKLHTIAGKLSRGEFKNVVVLTGAGVSVAAGIPDFRSPGGMYQTLRPELLTATEAQRESMRDDPSQVVSWDIFSQNQLPYLELRRSFILDIAQNRWKPTLSHYFIRVLHDNGVLRRLYTQNIDGLDNQVGLAQDKMVQLHGTLANISCEFCSAPYPSDEFRKQVQQRIKDITGIDRSAPATSSTIPCGECGQPGLKPSTVLYGRSLPSTFYSCTKLDFPKNVDLLIVAGTSLTVAPANSLPMMVSPQCYRVVINRDHVGEDCGLDYEGPTDIFEGVLCCCC